jgi:hypothetical protein
MKEVREEPMNAVASETQRHRHRQRPELSPFAKKQ